MERCVPESIIKNNFPLSQISSMRTGGTAKVAYFPETEEQFIAAIKLVKQHSKVHIFGNASNVLFPDDASSMEVIFTTKLKNIKITGENSLYCSCGTMLTELSRLAAKNSLSGLEFAFGIPGSFGGGIFMNAGAYGGELCEVLEYVEAYDINNDTKITLDKSLCEFSYRNSRFMRERNLVILGGGVVLKKGDSASIMQKCNENMRQRREKQPLEYPSCGSAFKRPQGSFAGKLIEDCGLKGLSVGGAQISEKHAGFIINKSNATSDDVCRLIELVKQEVYNKFGVLLCPEIEIIEENKQ